MALDRFSAQSAGYARYRINYPPELYAWLLPQLRGRERAWDCATGNGQVAVVLADYFREVEATDLSEKQLAAAERLPNIHYQVAPAERTPFPAHCFDLITAAQAVHWFEAEDWHREVRRVARPGAVLAEWGYTFCRTDNHALNAALDHFHDITSAPYWDTNRQHIADEYARIAFPFGAVQTARFAAQRHWAVADMLGYLRTWSAAANYARRHGGADLVALVADEMTQRWGPGLREVTFPVFARAGRV